MTLFQHTSPRRPCQAVQRHGAVLPLFAVLLPVLLILAGFAVNVAYMQLTRTELKVATDASAKAGGRAFSEFQDVDQALAFAKTQARRHKVGGKQFDIDTTDNTGDVDFGRSARANNGYGRYTFTKTPIQNVRSMQTIASSMRIQGKRTSNSLAGSIPLPVPLFGSYSEFQPEVSSIVTQVDRDIALILDRSGSMAESAFNWSDYYTNTQEMEWRWNRRRGWHQRQVTVRTWDPAEMEQRYNTYNSEYSDYYYDHDEAPTDSRWGALESAVDAFLSVLEQTDQEEQVSVATFASSARLDLNLQTNFDTIRNLLDGIRPSGATSIGSGMQSGMPTLIGNMARPYAAKTIVVLTDGINNTNPTPQSVATALAAAYNVTIHTVSLSQGADQTAMRQVAQIGGGKHYHADDISELVDIFRKIANNLPTVITE